MYIKANGSTFEFKYVCKYISNIMYNMPNYCVVIMHAQNFDIKKGNKNASFCASICKHFVTLQLIYNLNANLHKYIFKCYKLYNSMIKCSTTTTF